jgi:hypothetical protein
LEKIIVDVNAKAATHTGFNFHWQSALNWNFANEKNEALCSILQYCHAEAYFAISMPMYTVLRSISWKSSNQNFHNQITLESIGRIFAHPQCPEYFSWLVMN